jgi:hypothetical protein
VLLHIATPFRAWNENSSAFFHHRGVSTPHITLGHHGPHRDANREESLFFPHGCHGLRELTSAVTRAVGCALNPPQQWRRDTARPCPIAAGQESGATGLVILSEGKNPDHCHALRCLCEKRLALNPCVGKTWEERDLLDPSSIRPFSSQEKGEGDELRGSSHSIFRTWTENLPAFFHHRGVSTPHITQGRHGPYREANRVQWLFSLLLSLEESNQRTLRNRNARFNRRPACHRFRCVRSE